jgi:hypothetical protein
MKKKNTIELSSLKEKSRQREAEIDVLKEMIRGTKL